MPQYYKHVTIVNDDSSIISKWSFKLSDDPRVVIYDCHWFKIQATVLKNVLRSQMLPCLNRLEWLLLSFTSIIA
jgi:hypothetical protein